MATSCGCSRSRHQGPLQADHHRRAWAVIQPLATMLVFYALFRLMGAKAVSQRSCPMPCRPMRAVDLATVFHVAYPVEQQPGSRAALIKKVYFPRLIFPLAPILAALLDFAIALVLLFVLMAWYGVRLHWTAAALPLFVFMAVVTALAVGLWFLALIAMYRDFRYVVPFMTQDSGSS